MSNDDKLKLAKESNEIAQDIKARKWRVMVVDDEVEVHAVTCLALEGFQFAGRGLEFINAYSGREACTIMKSTPDIALILLDVVMETDHAGLETAKYIRQILKNRFVRIVLRTGQPGQAPEYNVITEFDINDYKEKTELTRQKLFTSVYTSLSSYRDLMALEKNRRGLLKVIDASAYIFELRAMGEFAEGVLEQLAALLYLDQEVMVVRASGIAVEDMNGHIDIVAATGRFKALVGEDCGDKLDHEVFKRINVALITRKSDYGSNYFVGYYSTTSGVNHVLYVSADQPINVPDISLIEMFARNVAIAHENIKLMKPYIEGEK